MPAGTAYPYSRDRPNATSNVALIASRVYWSTASDTKPAATIAPMTRSVVPSNRRSGTMPSTRRGRGWLAVII